MIKNYKKDGFVKTDYKPQPKTCPEAAQFKIDILLSTYNGEKYLSEQIASILNQTFTDWQLLVRDDGSSDGTLDILKHYCKKYPEQIRILNDDLGNLGSGASFAVLMKQSTAPYIMFCDQDDVWFTTKIEWTFSAMQDLSKCYSDIPLLVATDLMIVDEQLNKISESFIQDQKLYPDVFDDVHKCLALSVAPGCTMMLNRKAVEKILPVPFGHLHDHWSASIVSYYGKIFFYNQPTLFYRQHTKNVCGRKIIGIRYYFIRLCKISTVFWKRYDMYSHLPFRINCLKYIYYTLYYAMKRMF